MEKAEHVSHHHVTTPFPPIDDLLRESWTLFTNRLTRLFAVGVISIGVYGILIILAGIAFITTLVTNIGPYLSMNKGSPNVDILLPHIFNALPVVIVIGGIFVVLSVIMNAIIKAWYLLSLREKDTTSFGTIFKEGFQYVWPLVLVSLLLFIIEFGGFLFFVIPGIAFAVLFAFAPYEVIFDKHEGVQALKRSYQIISSNFWELFVRILVIWLAYFVLSIIPRLFGSHGADMGIRWIIGIIDFLLSWYALCYTYTLYKQAKERTDFARAASLTWVWIISILGWVLFLVLSFFIIMGVTTFIQSGQFNRLLNQIQQEMQSKNNYNNNMYPPNQMNNPDYRSPSQPGSRGMMLPRGVTAYPSQGTTGGSAQYPNTY